MKKKLVSLLLVAAMGVSMVACGNDTAAPSTDAAPASTEAPAESEAETTPAETEAPVDLSAMDYDQASAYVYDQNLGEFYETYMAAKEAETVSEKYALMAIAEAKLLESGVMLPLTSNGGMYAIARVAPNTSTSTMWGNDYKRFHQYIVTTEPIKTEHRTEMKAKWSEVKGQGTYEQWAKDYLVEKGYTLKDTYTMPYPSDPKTWDVLATSLAADSEAIINTYDGLVEYDMENVLQPALAESWTVSDDGLTYTFKIREGATWVDSQGRKVADVVADDFVAGLQHMLDAMGGLEYLVEGVIVNASEYINGEVTDFSEVGVKAVDDHTLEYHLVAPTTYFTTMLGYGVFAPMSRSYYTSQGGKFGAEYDPSAADYSYGKTPDNIAYCGPYVVTNATAQNTIVFKANESYWNADNINVKTLTWLFSDGSDATKAYNDMKAGVLDGCSLNASALELAKEDGWFDQYHYVSSTDSSSFMAFFNLNRGTFANFNDETVMVSTQTPEEAERTRLAMNNVNFRRAVCFAMDRPSYNAQSNGEDLKLTSIRNTYTPGTFVALEEEVTVDINGTATTFPAGTFYGEIIQAQLDADGMPIKAWDPAADDGIGSSDGFDGWYHPEEAAAELEIAIEALAAQGVTIDEANPIHLDLPYASSSETFSNRAQAFKQSVEASLGGKVVIDLVAGASAEEWYYAGYYGTYGYEGNYDLNDVSAWGADYGDPATYLDTFLPDYAGFMVKQLGIY